MMMINIVVNKSLELLKPPTIQSILSSKITQTKYNAQPTKLRKSYWK